MTHMMSETTVAKIPVLSEKSALSIFGRVLSGEIKVRIGEIVHTDPVHRAHLGFARRANSVHRAEPRWGLFSKFNSKSP